jgi:redox-sensitive bicupin YhaK (pirin superfamily)
MIAIRKAADRGVTRAAWLDSRHTFSFGDYHDPRHHNFRTLRVLNDDRLAPGGGFPMHPHRDMEIITYVLSGELEHRDSMGNGEIISAGEWQAMHAGTGILHSEFNPSEKESVHLLQIWILPDRRGHTPGYQQRRFDEADRPERLRLVASPDGAEGSLVIHQDARVYRAALRDGQSVRRELSPGRAAYVHVASGSVRLNGAKLDAGDGAALEQESALELTGADRGDVLVFDLA